MVPYRLRRWLLLALAVGRAAVAAPAVTIATPRHPPCNLFLPGEAVAFEPSITAPVAGVGELRATLADFGGATVASRAVPFTAPAGRAVPVQVDLGPLPVGYYELRLAATVTPAGGAVVEGQGTVTFGVLAAATRPAAEVRRGDYRFGMKLWLIGDIWWNRQLKWEPREVVDACTRVGLPWTRALLSQRSDFDTGELLTQYPVGVVLKIESFPEACYDADRYGPLATFSKTEQGRAWSKCTRPREAAYREWLRAELERVPHDQRVFEIWNEPWQWHQTMTTEDFAAICRWTAEVIRAARPDAVVGPNIYGSLTPYDQAVVKAGGLDGMQMVAIHPYTAGTPEQKGFRQQIRNYRDWLRRELGRDLDLYATEYGWATAPAGERCVSEADQARRTVRESLLLYAEGVRTLIPHTMGQREQDPKDREHWFGFFRLTHEPKPALVALATCAQQIDGGRFVGDLDLGPGVGAMLFERAGTRTLALWTADEARTVEVDVAAEAVTALDLVGRGRRLTTRQGRLAVPVSGDVTYLVGVGAGLDQRVTKPDGPLSPDLWHQRPSRHTAPRLGATPVIDGDLAEWQAVPGQLLHDPKQDDLRVAWRLAWDEAALYVAAEVADRRVINQNEPGRIEMGDVLDLHIGARPDRQLGQEDLYDYQLLVAPTSAAGRPVTVLRNIAAAPVVSQASGEGDLTWAVRTTATGWTVEAAVPWRRLPGAAGVAGRRLAFNLVVYDRDRDDPAEWQQFWKRVEVVSKKGRPDEWPDLMLR